MQIVMILYNSLPFDPRVFKEAYVLSEAGYDVSVLDVDLKLGESPIPRGVTRRTVLKTSFLKRTSVGGVFRFWMACLKYLVQNRQSIDIVHAHDLTGLPPAFAISVLCPRIRLVYDSHENFPEAAMDELSYLHYAVFLGLELVCSTRVDWLFSVSPCCLRTLSHRIGAHPFLLMNVPDLGRIESQLGYIPRWKPPRNDGAVRIVCPSVIRARRGFERLPEAAEILNATDVARFEFLIVGDGPLLPYLRRVVEERGLEDYFTFTGRVSFEEVLRIMVECDMAIAMYEEGWNTNSGLSNKIFEYMMVGVPFIYSNLTQSLPLLERVNAYILQNPTSAQDIANAILTLSDSPARMMEISEKGPPLIINRFNWSKESERLLRVYREIHEEVFG